MTAGSATIIASGGTAPGGTADYLFFGGTGNSYAGVQPTNLTNFSLSAPRSNQYGNDYGPRDGTGGPGGAYGNSPNAPYSSVTAPGGSSSFISGIAYQGASGPTTADLFTLTLGSNSLSSFTFYVLVGNTDQDGPYDTGIGVSADGGAAVTASVTEPNIGVAGAQNQFIAFLVTGAMTGDTFTFSASTPDAGSESDLHIGGVTVDESAPAPEPGLLAILRVGLTGLWLRRRKR